MVNEKQLMPIIKKFYNKIKNEEFNIDKTGAKCVELIGEKIKLNPNQPILDFLARKTNEEYCKKELDWYLSQDLSIINHVDDVKIWQQVCSKDDKKEINSNYGWCIYSKENGEQFSNCLNELIRNKESRRAVMIYTRPSMWRDYNESGKNDFICTDGVQCFIRKNKLEYIIKQRSCDLVFGLFNDFYWHCFVYKDLQRQYNNCILQKTDILKNGKIIYFPFSLHVYEKHFPLIQKIIKKYTII